MALSSPQRLRESQSLVGFTLVIPPWSCSIASAIALAIMPAGAISPSNFMCTHTCVPPSVSYTSSGLHQHSSAYPCSGSVTRPPASMSAPPSTTPRQQISGPNFRIGQPRVIRTVPPIGKNRSPSFAPRLQRSTTYSERGGWRNSEHLINASAICFKVKETAPAFLIPI